MEKCRTLSSYHRDMGKPAQGWVINPASHNYLCAVLEEIGAILTFIYSICDFLWFGNDVLNVQMCSGKTCEAEHRVKASYLTSDCIFHKALVEMMWCMPILLHLSASLGSFISSWISIGWLINDASVKQNFSTSLDYSRCYPELSYLIRL